MIHPYPIWFALVFATLVLPNIAAAQDDDLRAIEFETTEVTAPDVAVSPDGEWLVFTMLGHLFRLPVEGGTADQLTFGPYYDTDHAISPDASRVAFVSDRDGSEGNVFVLELASGKITQVTHESWAGRPTWTPDGRAIVYLSFVLEETSRAFWGPSPSLVRRVALSGGEPETVAAPESEFRSLFYLPDGRLAWTLIERENPSRRPSFGSAPRVTTRIEVIGPQGTVSSLATLGGIEDRVVAASTGDGLYCRRYVPLWSASITQEDYLVFLSLPEGTERRIAPVSGISYWSPRFAVAADNKTLYVGNSGRLWKIAPSGAREPIAFSAQVKLDVQDTVAPPKWAAPVAGISAPPRHLVPMLSPDGRSLVFMAAGYLWQQPLDNGPAQRLFEGSAFESDAALSPDGKRLAFVHSKHGKAEIRVFDFESGNTRSLLAAEDPENLGWSPDGQQVAFIDEVEDVKVIDLASGQTRTVASGDFHPHLSWSADAQQLIFCDHEYGTHRVVAVNLSDGTRKVLAAELPRDAGDVQLSPDGESLYFSAKGGDEIWVAPLGKKSVREQDIRRLSPEGGATYTVTPDGSVLIYSVGNRVWRQPLDGGEREQIPVRLELQRPTPPPVLVQRARVLDFTSGSFGPETSLFIEQGRIRSIGSERGRRLPPDTVTLDAGGRFAIPGLFDMHVHGGSPTAYVAYGVTSVRNTGGSLGWLNALADRSETTSDPVPRYFYSGDFLVSRKPPGQSWGVLLNDEEDARRYVRQLKERGAHFIKVYYPITVGVQRALAEEAHRLRLPVVGHGMRVDEVTKSVTLGYATLEHGDRFYDDLLKLMAVAGTRWDPTLAAMFGNALLLREEPERVANRKLRMFTPEWQIRAAMGADRLFLALSDDMLRGRWVGWLAAVRQANRHGVRLLAGSDAGDTAELFPGVSLHWELEYFVRAGLTPLEVLRIATQQGAEAVGADGDLGTLAPGKLADIVLLDSNPLEDIKNTQTIWRVIKGGWVFDPEELRPDRN